MAKYGFFINNQCNGVAESEEEKNTLSAFKEGAVIKTLTEDQFNNVKNLKSTLTLNGENVEETFMDDAVYYNNASINAEEAKNEINELIQNRFLPQVTAYCLANPDDTYWADYKQKLEEVDIASLTFPLSYETFQEWFNNQSGYPSKSILQCP